MPGAISLTVDGVELLGPELWDDVNWLWPFVILALDECRRSGAGQRYFPDQPIEFFRELRRLCGDLASAKEETALRDEEMPVRARWVPPP